MAISYAQVGGFYLYVGVVKTITCCGCYTSGLSAADFTLGNYAIFKTVGITGAAAPAMFFIGLILLLGGIILLWDFCKRNRYAYGDKVSDC
ncbi:MAG: hypothetical protein MJ233_02695 [Mycoplasmoidaceae bacterium]|nr:hypothetical protein [Mycoplasmoidaceae bacterium]